METVDLFDDTVNESPHPRLRGLVERLQSGQDAKLELFRPPIMLGLSSGRMRVHFLSPNGQELAVNEVDWDPVVNDGLIAHHVRAVDKDQESERFALALRDALRVVGKEYGNGYFNSALLELIRDNDAGQVPVVKAMVEQIPFDPLPQDAASSQCRKSIALTIQGRARELKQQLNYAPEEAHEILASAIAKYLDERFSVSQRRNLKRQ